MVVDVGLMLDAAVATQVGAPGDVPSAIFPRRIHAAISHPVGRVVGDPAEFIFDRIERAHDEFERLVRRTARLGALEALDELLQSVEFAQHDMIKTTYVI